MIDVLIVDDEPYARKGMRILLAGVEDIEIVGEAGSGVEAVDQIRQQQPDLVFLDIQMPGMNGFQVLENLTAEELPVVVFVTAFDEYAVQAFEACAFDYLLKPVKEARLQKSLDRARSELANRRSGQLEDRFVALLESYRKLSGAPSSDYLHRITVRTREGEKIIRTEDIAWIEAQDYYVAIHIGGTQHLAKASMAMLEKRLDPRRFVRVHRSTIVNLDAVDHIETTENSSREIILRDGTRRRVSRKGRQLLQAAARYLP